MNTEPAPRNRAMTAGLLAVAGLGAAAAILAAAAGPHLALAPLVWLGALWAPGLPFVLAARRPDGGPGPSAAWLPFALGPVAFGAGVTLGRLAGIPLAAVAAAVPGLAFLTALALALPGLRRAGPHPEPAARPGRAARAAPAARAALLALVLAGAGAFLLGALPPLLHAPLRVRDDALLHLPIIERILAGSFPPEDPFLAGTPLPYFWFYHAVMAGADRLSGIPLPLSLTLLNLQALALLLFGLDRAGRRLGLSAAARVFTLALFALGLTPWGWMRYLWLHLARPDINWALARTYGVAALFPLLNPTDPRLVAPLTKIAISNAFPFSLALFVLAATPPRRAGFGTRLTTAMLAAGCALFHLVTGILLFAGLVTAWLAARFLPAAAVSAPSGASEPGGASGAGPEAPGDALAGPGRLLAVALAAAVVVPYAWAVIGARAGSGAATLVPQPGRALVLNLALAGIWLLALPAFRSLLRAPAGRNWLAAGLPALGLPFAVHLIDGNEYKALFVLLVLLAPAAGAGLARLGRGRPWLAALILAVFLPTPLLAARGYLTDNPPGTLSAADRREVEAVGAALPADAVLWRPQLGTGYFAYTFPLGRAFYLSDRYALEILGRWNGEEARWRRGSLELAGRGEVAEALAAAESRVRGRPLYPVVTREDALRYPGLGPALRRLGLRPVGTAAPLTVYGAPPPRRPPNR